MCLPLESIEGKQKTWKQSAQISLAEKQKALRLYLFLASSICLHNKQDR